MWLPVPVAVTMGAMAQAVETIVISLGSNLGDARSHLAFAVARIGDLDPTHGCRVLAVSALYRTVPWQADGPDFLNAVVVLQGPGDDAAPHRLLHALQDIERARGRERPYRYAPRTLDLDLILYGPRIVESADLVLPHPRALQRAFVLRPLADVMPDINWPGLGAAWQDHLAGLSDPPPVPLDDPDWPSQRGRRSPSP
ncbi:MAG: 2-amino-4-hydroxy-6-hydroxymethyldihydropteridine diphosphokinase [Pseudomonadota bacterium]|jgi:2-amino-4-hydroxy-6-hydroxymethyldihydropteridine diphosphokinase